MKWILPVMIGIMLLGAIPMAHANGNGEKVIITEILPDPAGSDLNGEFVEIMNAGNEAVWMKNWTISDQDGSVDFTFPDIWLEPEQRAVVFVSTGNYSIMGDTYYFYMNKSASMLNNNGDDVLLSDSEGNPVDYVAYGSGKYVDAAPDGLNWNENITAESGLSLERSNDTGELFWGVPTPGRKNPNMDSNAHLEISSFYPYPRHGDEFVEIKNTGKEDADLSGYYITDGEGFLYFPAGTVIKANSSLYITQNRSGFVGEMGFSPNMVYSDCYTPNSYPQLANSGDELYLCNPSGKTIFSVSYGDGDGLGPAKMGYIYRYDGSWEMVRAGRSSFSVFRANYSGNMSVFSSPDSSLKAVVNEINEAKHEILINTYEFTSQEIAQALLKAISRGVDVRILIEGGPVGGVPDEEMGVLDALYSAGADIRMMDENDRYSFDHAKYMIVDKSLIIESENFNREAMPAYGEGNRGWGVIIRNGSAVRYMKEIFMEDSNLNFSDISEFEPYDADLKWEPLAPELNSSLNISGQFNISIMVGPEHGLDEIMDAINHAKMSVYIEQFYIKYKWGDSINPLIGAILNASLRGCDIRILLDGSYYNTDGEFDNDELAEFFNNFGKENGVNLSARVIDLERHGLVKVHNKGMIIDGKITLVSSFNWGMNSFTNNRELAVMVDNRDVASYFSSLFMKDWKSDFEAPIALIDGYDTVLVNHSYVFKSASMDNNGIASQTWYLDGSEISKNDSVVLNFSPEGQHILSLTVRDMDGNENETELRIDVVAKGEIEKEDEISNTNMPVNKLNKNSTYLPYRNRSAPHTITANNGTDNQTAKNDGIRNSGYNAMTQYLLVIPSLLILMSAMKISWKKNHS
jgi:cardiolipin synthase